MINRELINSVQEDLSQLTNHVRALQYAQPISCQYTLGEIHDGVPKESLKSWLVKQLDNNVRQPAIYSLEADSTQTAQTLRATFSQVRSDSQRQYSLPKLNEADESITTLYVGRTAKVRQRLKQHLWEVGAAKTYALNMHRWVPNQQGSVTLRVQSILGSPNSMAIQCVEDALWKSLKPMFGKLGGR